MARFWNLVASAVFVALPFSIFQFISDFWSWLGSGSCNILRRDGGHTKICVSSFLNCFFHIGFTSKILIGLYLKTIQIPYKHLISWTYYLMDPKHVTVSFQNITFTNQKLFLYLVCYLSTLACFQEHRQFLWQQGKLSHRYNPSEV